MNDKKHDSLFEALEENNRLLRTLMLTHQDVYARARQADMRRMIESLNLQDEWAERYGECVPSHVAAKIIGRSPGCVNNWANDGRIIRSDTGGILTRSLAAYVQQGVPQGKYVTDAVHPNKRPKMGAQAEGRKAREAAP